MKALIQLLSPEDVVMELAERKAQAVFKENPESFVLGSDTLVVADDQILGKPADEEDAIAMLKMLSGKQHDVYTGVSILSPKGSSVFMKKQKFGFGS